TAFGSGFIANDVVAQPAAFVADEHRRASDQLAPLVLALAAERARQQLLARSFLVGHTYSRLLSISGAIVAARQEFVDQPIAYRILRCKEVVAVGIAGNPLERLPGHLGDERVETLAQVEDLARLDLDVGRLPLCPARWLVDHDAGVRQGIALALGAG